MGLPTDAQGATRAATGALELVASERPDDLPWLLDVLSNSPARFLVANLLAEWEIESIEELTAVVVKAAHDLGRLERRRHWSRPSQVVEDPHVGALHQFALRRGERVTGLTKQRRLTMIGRRLGHLSAKTKRSREFERWLDDFLGQPARRPLDPEWIRDFLKPESEP